MAGIIRRLLILTLAFSVAPVSAEAIHQDNLSTGCPSTSSTATSITVSDLSLTAGGLTP